MSSPSFERLSPSDAGYLIRETAPQPMHFVVQLDLADDVPFDRLRGHVAERIGDLDVLRRKVRWSAGIRKPFWVDDPQFHVDRHVTGWHVPLSDAAAVERALVELTVRRLPRDRPLWSVVVGQGPGSRTTVWFCAQHAAMDGGLLSAVLQGLFGEGGTSATTVAPSVRRAPHPLVLTAAVLWRRMFRRAKDAPRLGDPETTLPTSLTGPVSPARVVAHASVPLADVHSARRSAGATVNDQFLAAVTDALRSCLTPVPDQLVALVPRDVRRDDEQGRIGNRGWSMLLTLPTGAADAGERMLALKEATRVAKQASATAGTQGWRFDIALSNVRLGSTYRIAGVPVVDHRVTVPLQGENRLVGVLTTLGDRATLSFTADAAAFDDLRLLAALAGDRLTAAVRTDAVAP